MYTDTWTHLTLTMGEKLNCVIILLDLETVSEITIVFFLQGNVLTVTNTDQENPFLIYSWYRFSHSVPKNNTVSKYASHSRFTFPFDLLW